MASKLTQWINASLKNKGMTAKQAQKNAYKYKSISAAKKAGSLYYTDKNGKIMIAAYAEDLKNIPKVKPKADRKDGLLSKSGNPTQGPGNRGMREKKITTTTLPKTSSTAKPKPSVDAPVKPSKPVQPSGGGGNGKAKPTTNSAKLDAWKAGDKSLSSKEQFRLAKWAERNDLSVPRDLAKDRVRLSLKTSKNKGGPVTKKPKGAYAAGGMPMVIKVARKYQLLLLTVKVR